MINPSRALIDFCQKHCSDAPIDSPVVIIRLLEELIEKGKEKKGHEKQD